MELCWENMSESSVISPLHETSSVDVIYYSYIKGQNTQMDLV